LHEGESLTCAVADGAGGHPAGERASAAALASIMAAAIPSTHALGEAVTTAHARLHDEIDGDPSCRGMATTVAILVVSGEEVLLANVGDSRIYEVLPSGLLQLSVDDRAARPDWADEAHETSVLTQVVGGFERGVIPQPHVDRCPAEDGLCFLLCSDGVAACLSDDQVADCLSDAENDAGALRRLVDACLRAGAPDNVTVMLTRIRRGTADG